MNQYEEQLVVLATKTGLSAQDWADFLSCSAFQQKLIAKTYADQHWVRDKDVLAEVLAILGVIGTVASVVSGVAGAAGAVAALKAI